MSMSNKESLTLHCTLYSGCLAKILLTRVSALFQAAGTQNDEPADKQNKSRKPRKKRTTAAAASVDDVRADQLG